MTPMFDLSQDSGLSLLILLVPTANNPPPLAIISRPSQECVRNADFVDFTKIMSSRSKDLHEINVSTDFQRSMQDLGYLVNITHFEFLCRKLNFGHVGIVQNFFFFIKSARRSGKTISTLASQRVACVRGIPRPMAVHF